MGESDSGCFGVHMDLHEVQSRLFVEALGQSSDSYSLSFYGV